MEENIIDRSFTSQAENFTLKILFGPMFGCELHLPADDYFIIIHPGLEQKYPCSESGHEIEHTASFAHNTLYIPCDMPSPNLVLRLSQKIDDETGSGYQIEIKDINGCYSTLIGENRPFHHEHVCLALKSDNIPWSEQVTGYKQFQTPAQPTSSLERISSFNRSKQRALLGAGLLLLLLIAGGIVTWYKHFQHENRIVALNVSLAGSPTPLKVIHANDDNLYVFAEGHREMDWLREVLFKLNESSTVIPVLTSQAKKEIVKNLYNQGYPVLQMDLSTPKYPTLSTYRALTLSQEHALKTAVLQEMPYVEKVEIIVQDKEMLLKQAQNGLERLHIPYRQINTGNGYALIVRDALSDNALSTLGHFITEFYNQWGNQVINFSINLNENWLQDKSYLDAKGGYLFLNPLHWYFPLKQGDAEYG